jgi:hypothetical protein
MMQKRIKAEAQASGDRTHIKIEPGTLPSINHDEPRLMQLAVASVSSTQVSHSMAIAPFAQIEPISHTPKSTYNELGSHAGIPSESTIGCRDCMSSETLVSGADTCFPHEGENVEPQLDTQMNNSSADKSKSTGQRLDGYHSNRDDDSYKSDSGNEDDTSSHSSFEPESDSEDDTNDHECNDGEIEDADDDSKQVRSAYIDIGLKLLLMYETDHDRHLKKHRQIIDPLLLPKRRRPVPKSSASGRRRRESSGKPSANEKQRLDNQ